MQTITVSKNELIDALETNRTKHINDYQKALVGYYQKAEEKVAELLEKVKHRQNGGQLYINLDFPQSHEKDYDTALEMLGWHKSSTVELSQDEFREYIQDEWGWKARFDTTTALYR